MSRNYEGDFDLWLEHLRPADNSESADILRAVDELRIHRVVPSPEFKDELEQHLKSYSVSSNRPHRGQVSFRSRITRFFHSPGNGLPPQLKVKPLALGLASLFMVLIAVAAATSSGRATARTFTDLVGVTSTDRPSATNNVPGTRLPANTNELERQIGFKLLQPKYLPAALVLGGVHQLPGDRRSGVQLDYVSKRSPDVVLLSIRESQTLGETASFDVPGEQVVINGQVAVLSSAGGPITPLILQWTDGILLIEISCSLPVEELIRVAKSLY